MKNILATLALALLFGGALSFGLAAPAEAFRAHGGDLDNQRGSSPP